MQCLLILAFIFSEKLLENGKPLYALMVVNPGGGVGDSVEFAEFQHEWVRTVLSPTSQIVGALTKAANNDDETAILLRVLLNFIREGISATGYVVDVESMEEAQVLADILLDHGNFLQRRTIKVAAQQGQCL